MYQLLCVMPINVTILAWYNQPSPSHVVQLEPIDNCISISHSVLVCTCIFDYKVINNCYVFIIVVIFVCDLDVY